MSLPNNEEDSDYRWIRVLPKTKVPHCAESCLKLLAEEADQRPLCLHTLPPPGTLIEDIEKIISQSKANPDQNAVGRVISIVEMIKRNFAAGDENHTAKRHKPNPDETSQSLDNRLHQYNEYGSLESVIEEISKGSDLSEIEKKKHVMAYQEKVLKEFLNEERKRPRKSHTPWLKVYLSKRRISSFENTGNISYQKPENQADENPEFSPPEPMLSHPTSRQEIELEAAAV